MKYTLGCDPGLDGALCLHHPEKPLIIQDMPTHEIMRNRKNKRILDLPTIANFVRQFKNDIQCAIIETPSAMPGQGVTSIFSLGFSCGALQGIFAGMAIPIELVPPATWKKAMGLTADKDTSRRRAGQLRPAEVHLWERKKDDGRAEAFLLALYAERFLPITQVYVPS